jgi:zinc-ribbon domain
MSGLLRRLTRRRSATADETGSPTPESSEPAGATAETPAEPGGGQPLPAPDEQATKVLPATAEQPVVPEAAATEPTPAPVRDLPAGIDPGELAVARAASASRGKLRRRLRYLRRVRELLLRDLGGFVFEIHRSAGGISQEGHRRLIEAKAHRLAALDAELRGLETRLDEPHETTVLREPGIGGLCPECGELHASDAHYCSRCGAPLDAKARAKRDAAIAAAAQPAAEPAPAGVLWAGGPRPQAQEPVEKEPAEPSPVTSQWLALPAHETGAPTGEPPKGAEAAADEAPAVAGDEAPTSGDEPVAPGDDVAARADEPVAPSDDEIVAPADEAPTSVVAGDEPPAGDEIVAAGDETVAGDDETVAPGDEATDAPDQESAESSENGRRDEDVPPPVPDPLGSRQERSS